MCKGLGKGRRAQCIALSFASCLYSKRQIIKDWAPAIGVCAAIYFGNRTANLTTKQISLQNRPYVSIQTPFWIYETLPTKRKFSAYFGQENFGEKPAENFRLFFRAVQLTIERSLIEKKVEEECKSKNKPFLPEYAEEELYRLKKATLAEFKTYFSEHPNVSNAELKTFIGSLKIKNFFKYAFPVGDTEGLEMQPRVLYPKECKATSPGRPDIGAHVDNVINADGMLIVFIRNEYQSPVRDLRYSTSYLGYSTKESLEETKAFQPTICKTRIVATLPAVFYPLTEFDSWTEEHSP